MAYQVVLRDSRCRSTLTLHTVNDPPPIVLRFTDHDLGWRYQYQFVKALDEESVLYRYVSRKKVSGALSRSTREKILTARRHRNAKLRRTGKRGEIPSGTRISRKEGIATWRTRTAIEDTKLNLPIEDHGPDRPRVRSPLGVLVLYWERRLAAARARAVRRGVGMYGLAIDRAKDAIQRVIDGRTP